eukprot:2960159-Prymnesium_polylepis.1
MLHVNPKVRGQHPRLLERCARARAAAEQQVVFDERREITDSRLPARSAHHLASWGSVVAFATTECHLG